MDFSMPNLYGLGVGGALTNLQDQLNNMAGRWMGGTFMPNVTETSTNGVRGDDISDVFNTAEMAGQVPTYTQAQVDAYNTALTSRNAFLSSAAGRYLTSRFGTTEGGWGIPPSQQEAMIKQGMLNAGYAYTDLNSILNPPAPAPTVTTANGLPLPPAPTVDTNRGGFPINLQPNYVSPKPVTTPTTNIGMTGLSGLSSLISRLGMGGFGGFGMGG